MLANESLWVLPGWQNSGPAHWQTWWEQHLGAVRLEQHDWERPLRGDWVMRLEERLLTQQKPVVLVAHSLGCHLVSAWSQCSRNLSRVKAALLVAPPDVTRIDFPAALHSWCRPVREPLPFPAMLMASSNDPYCSSEAAREMAKVWACGYVELGPLGHVNASAGLKAFTLAQQSIAQMLKQEPDRQA